MQNMHILSGPQAKMVVNRFLKLGNYIENEDDVQQAAWLLKKENTELTPTNICAILVKKEQQLRIKTARAVVWLDDEREYFYDLIESPVDAEIENWRCAEDAEIFQFFGVEIERLREQIRGVNGKKISDRQARKKIKNFIDDLAGPQLGLLEFSTVETQEKKENRIFEDLHDEYLEEQAAIDREVEFGSVSEDDDVNPSGFIR